MAFPSWIVTVFCSLQGFFIFSGYLVTRSFLGMFDRVAPGIFGGRMPKIPVIPEFVRSFGLWFLLVPLVLCAVLIARRRAGNDSDLSTGQFGIGLILTLGIAFLFFWSALRAVEFGIGLR